MATKRFAWPTNGKALDANVVRGDNYRFTVLTDCLIRLEQDADGQFEDRATQMVFYRDFPAVEYTVKRENGVLTIETAKLVLTYTEGAAFAADTLSVTLKTTPFTTWHYGETARDLGGTIRTVDSIDGAIPLGKGICARCGYTAIADNYPAVLTEDGWFDVRKEGQTDVYFFGYGHDYRTAVADLYRLTGAPPMLPDYALGNWWSRYWAYSQEEYTALIERFERENIPFSVAVLDMDWHNTKIPEECLNEDEKFNNGWSGYTWNEELFPDRKAFLKFLADHHMKTALNLHPALGVRCHESMYEEMAKACGIDPATKEIVKFDVLNRDFMEKYFDIIHHPYEEEGVGFWWMDWQQGKDYWWIHDDKHPASPLEAIDPLFLLNHLHIVDNARDGKRPMLFSRYSGIGSHRYPVGFSGDSVESWESLEFQPYFTSTASNVGYSWWSHDIGGHMLGFKDDTMRVRWLQFGVFSPINRLHACNNDFVGKEPWNLGKYEEQITDEWLRLRHRMFPYNYTMNYRNHKDLLPLVQPMYYSHPEHEEAYDQKNQYWYGSEMIVAPITEKNDTVARLGRAKVWLPEGDWFDVFNGWHYTGDQTLYAYRPLEQMPVFAKAGGIVPMQKDTGDNVLGRKAQMELFVFPGADNTFALYEDEGDGSAYKDGRYATTEFSLAWGDKATFTIAAAQGAVDLLPEKRDWTVNLRGFAKDVAVAVTIGGKAVDAESVYDMTTHTMRVELRDVAVTDNVVITVSGESLVTDNGDAEQRMFDLLVHAQTSEMWKYNLWRNRERTYLPGDRRPVRAGWRNERTDEQKYVTGALMELENLYLGNYCYDSYL